jgi:tetratricopeptide (TPR) repeat protein
MTENDTVSKNLQGSYQSLLEQATLLVKEKGAYEDALPILTRLKARLEKLGPEKWARRPALEENYHKTMGLLVEVYQNLYAFDTALSTYEDWLKLVSDEERPIIAFRTSQCKLLMGRVDEALTEMRNILADNDDLQLLKGILANFLIDLNYYQEAENWLLSAVELLDADDAIANQTIYSSLWELYAQQERYNEAETVWENFFGQEEKPFYLLIYRMWYQAGNYERAWPWLEKEPNRYYAGLYKGLILEAEGKPDKAQAVWKKTSQTPPTGYQGGWAEWAEASLRVGKDTSEIFLNFVDMVSSTPKNLRLHDYLLFTILISLQADVDYAKRVRSLHFTLHHLLTINAFIRLKRPSLQPRDWALFTEFVKDEAMREIARPYFQLDGQLGFASLPPRLNPADF